MTDIDQNLDTLVKSVEEIRIQNAELRDKVARLEATSDQTVNQSETAVPPVTPANNGQPEARSASDNAADEALQAFIIIKEHLQNVKLPNDLKVDESRQGIQRKDQAKLNVITKCAKFAETTVKLVSTLKPDSVTEADLSDLHTIAAAQVRYLQEEHSMLMVNSTFGEGVEKLYKGFKRHDVDVEALQASVTLHNQIESNRSSQRSPRGGSSFRGVRGGFGTRGYGSYSAPRGRAPGYSYGYVHDHYNNHFAQQVGQRIPHARPQPPFPGHDDSSA